jgi:hypothetical protein
VQTQRRPTKLHRLLRRLKRSFIDTCAGTEQRRDRSHLTAAHRRRQGALVISVQARIVGIRASAQQRFQELRLRVRRGQIQRLRRGAGTVPQARAREGMFAAIRAARQPQQIAAARERATGIGALVGATGRGLAVGVRTAREQHLGERELGGAIEGRPASAIDDIDRAADVQKERRDLT